MHGKKSSRVLKRESRSFAAKFQHRKRVSRQQKQRATLLTELAPRPKRVAESWLVSSASSVKVRRLCVQKSPWLRNDRETQSHAVSAPNRNVRKVVQRSS